MTDIRFDGDWIHLVGTITKAATTDLMLDAPSRRRTNTAHRRALVHDFDDGLTVNWDNDYPGGVSINGCRQIFGANNLDWLVVRSRVHQQFGTDIMLDGGVGRRGSVNSQRLNPFRRALVHGSGDRLVVNFNRDYTGGVVISGRVTMNEGAVIGGMDVGAALTAAAVRVSELTAELAAARAGLVALTARVEALEDGDTP